MRCIQLDHAFLQFLGETKQAVTHMTHDGPKLVIKSLGKWSALYASNARITCNTFAECTSWTSSAAFQQLVADVNIATAMRRCDRPHSSAADHTRSSQRHVLQEAHSATGSLWNRSCFSKNRKKEATSA